MPDFYGFHGPATRRHETNLTLIFLVYFALSRGLYSGIQMLERSNALVAPPRWDNDVAPCARSIVTI